MSRGASPSQYTVKMLFAKAAGHCEFLNCREKFFFDNISAKKFNDSYVAHIIASDPKGPRGHSYLSHKLSDSLDNLILLCPKHHQLIDKYPDEYPEETLKKMKASFEARIELICDVLAEPETEMILFTSPIKQKQSVTIDYEAAAKAVVKYNPIVSKYGIPFSIVSPHTYSSPDYWEDCNKQLETWYNITYLSLIKQRPNIHLSIFPLAPIPLIIKLGFLLGDKHPIKVYQHFRNPDTWEWQSSQQSNTFNYSVTETNEGNKVALILSLSSEISKSRLIELTSYKAIYIISAERINVDCVQSEKDLEVFRNIFLKVLNNIKNTYNCEIDLYPAIPVSIAYEIGRRYMTSVYPKINIYDEYEGFIKTLSIGG